MTTSVKLRTHILDHLPCYHGDVFSTANIYLYLLTEHPRNAPSMNQLAAILHTMPDIRYIERNRWRYDPAGMHPDARAMMHLIDAHGTVREDDLQDRFGQRAVADMVRNGTIMVNAGEAMFTGLGIRRMAALREAEA